MANDNAIRPAPEPNSPQPPPSNPSKGEQTSTQEANKEQPKDSATGTNGKPATGEHAITVDAGADKSEEAKGRSNLGASLGATTSEEEKERASKANVAAEKVLSVSANLAKLLPSGAVLVFQTLSASFTNQGNCHTANKWLSALLVAFLTAACIFLTFTDSIVYKDKVYYGVALPRRLNIFALSQTEEKQLFRELGPDLKQRRLKALDWVHAFFTAIVFISIAMGDVGLQKCFVPDLDDESMQNVKELLRNAPLGLALLSSFVFMIFPTTRHGVGFDNRNRVVTDGTDGTDKKAGAASSEQQKAQPNKK